MREEHVETVDLTQTIDLRVHRAADVGAPDLVTLVSNEVSSNLADQNYVVEVGIDA
jgi:hypothetical protein